MCDLIGGTEPRSASCAVRWVPEHALARLLWRRDDWRCNLRS